MILDTRRARVRLICKEGSAPKCTVLSVFYTESRVKIQSTERAVKNTEVTGSESGDPCWSLSAVLLILASNTEVYLPSSAQ